MFNVAPLGTGGNAISPTLGGLFDNSGRFVVGTTTPQDGAMISSYTASSSQLAAKFVAASGSYSADVLQLEAPSATSTAFNYLNAINGGSTQLRIRGDGNVYNANGTYTTISDERYKVWEGMPQPNLRDGIRNLWLGQFDRYENRAHTGPAKRMFGVRAQQAHKVLGGIGVVPPANDNGPWEAQAEPFAFVALWGVKDLYAKSHELVARNDVHRREISQLRHENELLTRQIQALARTVALLEQERGAERQAEAPARMRVAR